MRLDPGLFALSFGVLWGFNVTVQRAPPRPALLAVGELLARGEGRREGRVLCTPGRGGREWAGRRVLA